MDRPASFLPTIKCSSCSQEIEISMMGEHICGKAAEEVAPPPANFDQFMSYGSKNSSSNNNNNNSNYGYGSRDQDRSNRLPPQVDTSAANRSYYRTGQLTPVSNSSGSQSVSPKTPVGMMMGGLRTGGLGGRGNDRGGNDRNAGGDDYFEPKIAGEFDSPSSAFSSSTQPRRPGGYGGLDDDAYPPPSSSPKRQPATNLLQRMNSIAPGPFDTNNNGGAGLSRKPTNARNAFPRQANNSDYSRENMEGRTLDDDDFQPPSFNRAGTFPRLSESAEPPSRTPSAPGPRPERRRQNDAYGNMANNNNSTPYGSNSPPSNRARRPSMGPDTSRPPPPRTSLLRPRTSGRDGSSTSSNSPSIPQINLAAEFGIGNPYHSASDSMSSTVSSVMSRPGGSLLFSSSQSSFSSASSFSTSSSSNSLNNNGSNYYNNAREQPREVPREQARKPSNAANMADFDSLMNDLQALNPAEERREERREERPSQNDRGRNGGGYGGFGASTTTSSTSNSRTSPDRRPQSRGRNGMRDEMDNSYGNGSLRREPSRARDQSIGANNGNSWSRGAGASNMAPRMPAMPTIPVLPPMPSRGNCKACGDMITGKSVSSADGRLTGRYHKACFVCTTCSEPFSSATFYVHNDQPYCERHYHAVNGSLCGSCGNGIEGSYLADEADSKFHPTCFVCADCRLPLEDGYFEVAGAVYCERDAWKRVQQTWLSQAPAQALTPTTAFSRGGTGMGNSLTVPRGLPSGPGGGNGLPSGPGVSRRPSVGLPNPNQLGSAARPFGLPSGNRLGPRPRMEKRMTRLGMM